MVVVVLALDAGFAAAAALDAAGFFSKKSVMEDWAVGFVFLAGFMYASLSSSSLSALLGEKKDYDVITLEPEKVRGFLLTTCVC